MQNHLCGKRPVPEENRHISHWVLFSCAQIMPSCICLREVEKKENTTDIQCPQNKHGQTILGVSVYPGVSVRILNAEKRQHKIPNSAFKIPSSPTRVMIVVEKFVRQEVVGKPNISQNLRQV